MSMISSFRGLMVGGGVIAAGSLIAATSMVQVAPDSPAPVSSIASAEGHEPVPIRSSEPSTATPGLPLMTDTLSTLEGVYTDEQAQAGKQVYDVECALCHGPREFSGRVFQITWTGQPLSSLFRHISLTMPLDNPGGLSSDKYVAVLAYILELNGYPSGEMELPDSTDELGGIMMERLPDPDTPTTAARSEANGQAAGSAGMAATTTPHGENRR